MVLSQRAFHSRLTATFSSKYGDYSNNSSRVYACLICCLMKNNCYFKPFLLSQSSNYSFLLEMSCCCRVRNLKMASSPTSFVNGMRNECQCSVVGWKRLHLCYEFCQTVKHLQLLSSLDYDSITQHEFTLKISILSSRPKRLS